MLFTIGHTDSYEQMFATQKPEDCVKVGRRLERWQKEGSDEWLDPYPGGIAFGIVGSKCLSLTALGYLSSHELVGYSVYGLDCGFDNVYMYKGWMHIVRDTRLIRLEQPSFRM